MRSSAKRLWPFMLCALIALTGILNGCRSDLPSAQEVINTVSDPQVSACRSWTGEQWRSASQEEKGRAAFYVTFTVIGTAQSISDDMETDESFANLEAALKDDETRAGFLETAESNESAITEYFDSAPEDATVQDFILYELTATLGVQD